jgi:molecular chaperone DnaK (HSP70)
MIVATYKGEDKHFIVEKISSMVLKKMHEIAKACLETTVKNAVVTMTHSVRPQRMLKALQNSMSCK